MDPTDSDDDALPVAVPLDDAHVDKPAPEQPEKPVPVTLITGAFAAEIMQRQRHSCACQPQSSLEAPMQCRTMRKLSDSLGFSLTTHLLGLSE